MCSPTYFISDLHLDPAQPGTCRLALDFLQQAHDAKAIYILGDLFEYWIGDDAGVSVYQPVIEALSAVSATGCELTIMLGNRDFLLGDAFAEAIGAKLVQEDELVIELDGEPVLLLHGDTLCTDDHQYQTFRQQVRNPQWQQSFLAKTIDERMAYAAHLREQSQQISADKSIELMDVNASQVQARFSARQCQTMIHGHTHRPCVHVDQATAATRLVLGDWHPDHACYAVKDANGLHLKEFQGQQTK